MLARMVEIKKLESWMDCSKAIKQIEADLRNYEGNNLSDYANLTLKPAAAKKVEAILAKWHKLSPDDDD